MSGADVQFLHLSAVMFFRFITAFGEPPWDRWTVDRVRNALLHTFCKKQLDGVTEGYNKKVQGLTKFYLKLAAAGVLVALLVLPHYPRQRVAKGSIYFSYMFILFAGMDQNQMRHPFDKIKYGVLMLLPSIVIATTMAVCPIWAILLSAVATYYVTMATWKRALVMVTDLTANGYLECGCLLLPFLAYPFHFIEAFHVREAWSTWPGFVWTMLAEFVLSAATVPLICLMGVMDVHTTTRHACATDGFGLDAAATAATSQAYLISHFFLRCMCFLMTLSRLEINHTPVLVWDGKV